MTSRTNEQVMIPFQVSTQLEVPEENGYVPAVSKVRGLNADHPEESYLQTFVISCPDFWAFALRLLGVRAFMCVRVKTIVRSPELIAFMFRL